MDTYIVVMAGTKGTGAVPVLRSGDPVVVAACVRAIMSRINIVQTLEGLEPDAAHEDRRPSEASDDGR